MPEIQAQEAHREATVRVKLAAHFLGPDLYHRAPGVWDMPVEWEFPSDAEIVSDDTPLGLERDTISAYDPQHASDLARPTVEERNKLTDRIRQLEKELAQRASK